MIHVHHLADSRSQLVLWLLEEIGLDFEVQADGQIDTVWRTPGLVVGDEWSDFLPDSKDLISDWRAPMSCGNFNVATGKCGGKGS